MPPKMNKELLMHLAKHYNKNGLTGKGATWDAWEDYLKEEVWKRAGKTNPMARGSFHNVVYKYRQRRKEREEKERLAPLQILYRIQKELASLEISLRKRI